ncbi:MAG: alpha/beta fold hydrolase [Chitinophagales bacterium]
MKNEIIQTSTGQIEYSIYGTGKPVLFLHGGHANSKETLTHKHLNTEQLMLITPSRPGYGNTPLANNKTPVAAAKYIVELMDKLGFASFCVVGISAGGLTAIAIAGLYPNRVEKLVLASSTSKRWLQPTDGLYRKAQLLFHPKTEAFTWAMLRFFLKFLPSLIIKSMAKELTTTKMKKFEEEEILDMKKMLMTQRSKSGFVTDLEHDLDENIITKITAPTLIVHSKNDNSISKEHPLHAKQKIKHSELIWVENKWGHLIWVGKESKAIVDNIGVFLEKK